MANIATTVAELTDIVERTLLSELQRSPGGTGGAQDQVRARVKDATVKVKAVFESHAGGEADISELVPLKLNANLANTAVHTLEMTLTTEPVKSLVGIDPQDVAYSLGRAIDAVRISVHQAAAGKAGLSFKSATVSIEFGVTEKGEISVLKAFSAGASRENANSITLTLGPG